MDKSQKYIKMDGMNEKLMPKYFIGSAHRENTDGKSKPWTHNIGSCFQLLE